MSGLYERILARTAPRIKRSTESLPSSNTDDNSDTASSFSSGVQNPNYSTLPIKISSSYVQSENPSLQYQNADDFVHIRPCTVHLRDILDYDDTEQHCSIKRCGNKRCKTCQILITDTQFTSNLTKKKRTTPGVMII